MAVITQSEEGREYLAREQARVDARKQEQSSSSSHKRAVSDEWDRTPEKFWRMGEEDVTTRRDVTATNAASSSDVSRGPAMDIKSRRSRKRVADVQSEDLEDNEQMDAKKVHRHPQGKGESLDGRMFIGNWEHGESETHNQRLEDKSCRRWIPGLRRKYGHHDSKGARCTMGFHKRGDQESSVQEDSRGKTILAFCSASVRQVGDRNRPRAGVA